MGKVYFHSADRKLTVNSKTGIKRAANNIFEEEMMVLNRIDYIFCSDQFLLQINRDFLQHDYFTDIITFDLSDTPGITGEVYISVDRVKENAVVHRTSFLDEVLRVIFHGALHLCGYKDKKTPEQKLMRAREDYYINKFHVEREKLNL
ncbi:rRNA maturation RNase YbeY [Panacibacter sp. DH6]|uniref:Endoribonuclease YbeY n=1 Tax=Panacibacter microcysteis TaxID=2793269 RepID=A0A931E594_9BACT|nr:rRNA maturation RNase YbeY [Panacibacter microcysteis]MBG9375756.1 rRNA maturation RNase YbeY [Panacibacter microcysteis]